MTMTMQRTALRQRGRTTGRSLDEADFPGARGARTRSVGRRAAVMPHPSAQKSRARPGGGRRGQLLSNFPRRWGTARRRCRRFRRAARHGPGGQDRIQVTPVGLAMARSACGAAADIKRSRRVSRHPARAAVWHIPPGRVRRWQL